EIVKDGVTGLLVAPGDPAAMAEAIAQALAHPEWCVEWRRAAGQAVRARFSALGYVQGVQQVYEAILR
ncbi:MAG: glycosyltransferase, partial [Chloroflexota bacterium]